MVKIGARALKIGVHLRFNPRFTVEFVFLPKNFRQAYCLYGYNKEDIGILSQQKKQTHE